VKFQNTTKVKETKPSNGTLKRKGQGQLLCGADEKKCTVCGFGFVATLDEKTHELRTMYLSLGQVREGSCAISEQGGCCDY
jgi:hypothetical protein